MVAKNVWDMTPTLAVKLGSIIIHYEEHLEPGGHPFDRTAAETLRQDAEVAEWFKKMQGAAMLPLKRR